MHGLVLCYSRTLRILNNSAQEGTEDIQIIALRYT